MQCFVRIIVAALGFGFAFVPFVRAEAPETVCLSGKKLGTVFNNDSNNIIYALDEKTATPDGYLKVLRVLLDRKPGVLAQCVGFPDPVIYPSKVATRWDKYAVEAADLLVKDKVWKKHDTDREVALLRQLFDAGANPLDLAIQACRERGVLFVASYRMNSEDWYHHTYRLSELGRAHPEYRIGKSGALDPAVPEVYAHRMKIFREVATEHDVDGIELDFRRWYRMVSDPSKNHVVLTRMVRDCRKMLDEVAREKGRKKLLLGVRVGPSLDSPSTPFLFPGVEYVNRPANASCKELGLDVKTWIKEELVDYVCPAVFMGNLPGMPLTREFTDLAKGTEVGIYPFLPCKAAWMHATLGTERTVKLKGDDRAMALYKYDLCTTALRLYADGADGISTFNWYSHLRDAQVPYLWTKDECGDGADAIQTYVYPLLGDPAAIREYSGRPWALPPGDKTRDGS